MNLVGIASARYRVFGLLCFGSSLVAVVGGCSLDASIDELSRSVAPALEDLNRKNPDFIHGELVTTNNGYRFTVVFGEISEKKSLSSGWQVEGAFYE